MPRIPRVPNPLADLGDTAQIEKLDLGVSKQIENLGLGDTANIQRAMRHTTQPILNPTPPPNQPIEAARLRPGSRPSSMAIPGARPSALDELESKLAGGGTALDKLEKKISNF